MFYEKIAYTVKEASAATGISRSSIYNLIHDNKLETRKVGRRTLIPATSLKGLLKI
jgi:excisionase family DNA binding protein